MNNKKNNNDLQYQVPVPAQKTPKNKKPRKIESDSTQSIPRTIQMNSDNYKGQQTIKRIHPRSFAKTGFFISSIVAGFFMVASLLLYLILSATSVLDKLANQISGIGFISNSFNITDLFGFGTVFLILLFLALTFIISTTLLSGVFAFIYNFSVKTFGGIKVEISADSK